MHRSHRYRLATPNLLEARSLLAAIIEYPIDISLQAPVEITKGANSDLWFTMQGSNKVGRITTDGAITAIDAGLSPTAVAVQTNGTVWVRTAEYKLVENPSHRPGIPYPPGFRGSDFITIQQPMIEWLNPPKEHGVK